MAEHDPFKVTPADHEEFFQTLSKMTPDERRRLFEISRNETELAKQPREVVDAFLKTPEADRIVREAYAEYQQSLERREEQAGDQFDRDVRLHYESRAKPKRVTPTDIRGPEDRMRDKYAARGKKSPLDMAPEERAEAWRQNQFVQEPSKVPGWVKFLMGFAAAGVLIMVFPVVGILVVIGGIVYAAYLKGRSGQFRR